MWTKKRLREVQSSFFGILQSYQRLADKNYKKYKYHYIKTSFSKSQNS